MVAEQDFEFNQMLKGFTLKKISCPTIVNTHYQEIIL